MRPRFVRLAIVLAALGPSIPVHAGDGGIEFFEKKIRPVLVEHCYKCHAADAKKIRGELLLDSRAGIRKGGESGPVMEPGNPAKSLLIKALRYTDEALKMPPQGRMPASVIADFETWVKIGAPDPRDNAASAKGADSWAEVLRTRRSWWSLQPVRKPAVPQPKNTTWSLHPIDRFLLAKLEEKNLPPAAPANPRMLIRRLSLVLTGLPPTPTQVESFVRACAAAAPSQPLPSSAVEKLVDSLLASPHFGERWARHWLDVVRFTETHGNEWNYEVHHAWRYRDYLIRAFNDDVPYDQFVREHIAGDLLPRPRWNRTPSSPPLGKGVMGGFNESVIGTGFYRFGEVNHDDCIDLRSIGYDLVDNQIDTLTKAFQALTVACARCHDHKLDAVSMRDYHGLLGILRSSRQVSHTIDPPEVNAETMRKMGETKQAIRRELAAAWLKELEPTRVLKTLAAKTDDKVPMENPLWLWRQLAARKEPVATAWKSAAEQYAKESDERARFNQNFTTLADFRKGGWSDWHVGGHGLGGTPSSSGAFTIAADGEKAVAAILPAGAYTHAFSEKLNGTLRSPVLAADKKYISFQVLGERASAVRLVSNNCQLNYRNYRYLTANQLHWITFPLPKDGASLRVYAELMTKFDNPKFPDQLGQLGGDKRDYRIPWEQAATDPRSHFGVTHVVIHDQPEPPKAPLAGLRDLFAGPPPVACEELAQRYSRRLEGAVRAWRDDEATDDDARWLDAFLQRSGLLSNRAKLTPKLEALIAQYRKLDGELALPRIVPGLADAGPGFEQPIFARGDCLKPGEKAPRRFVEVLSPSPFAPTGSGRLELANAIASPDNPLTARVMVNRIWHHLFGAGLVRSVDDFGHVGDTPSHPELLDYLAHQFMRPAPSWKGAGDVPPSPSGRGAGGEGWSIKRLIRAIVLTRTFQLSHQPSPAALEADPNNRLLSYYSARRMEAEAIRDALLAASGRLDPTLYGMSIPAYREKDYADRRLFKGPLDGNGRRSIYIKVTLMEAPKFLEVFNFPGGKVTQGRRDVTNVPAQALAMLNDPFVLQQADLWNKRLAERMNDTVAERIEVMFRTALGRDPGPEERERFARFVSQVAALHNVPADGVLASAEVWCDVAHTMFNVQEFITVP